MFFQLFSYTRSPFYLGRNGDVEGNKVTTHRSLMLLHYSVVAGNTSIADNLMFSTSNNLSSMVSNPYFPHTVCVTETKSCARCHTLEVDVQTSNGTATAIASDHFISEASARGTGRYMNVTDWAHVATTEGLDQVDTKKEVNGGTNVWPGFLLSDQAPRHAPLALPPANDVLVVRGVSFHVVAAVGAARLQVGARVGRAVAVVALERFGVVVARVDVAVAVAREVVAVHAVHAGLDVHVVQADGAVAAAVDDARLAPVERATARLAIGDVEAARGCGRRSRRARGRSCSPTGGSGRTGCSCCGAPRRSGPAAADRPRWGSW